MPIKGERHRFTTWQISGAPAASGVYLLWEKDEPIYVGFARGGEATIRSRLQDHYTRRSKPHDATHFSFERTADPAGRETEVLDDLLVDSALASVWFHGHALLRDRFFIP